MENLLASCLLIFGLIFAEAQPAGPASWTAADGRVIQAQFIKLDGAKLTIEKDGRRFTLDLSARSPENAAQARKLARPSSAAQEPIQIKVLVLNYDPKFEGKVLHAVFGWNDPRDLVKGYIDDLQEVSGGCCSFRSWSGVTSMKSMPVRTAAASRSRILSGPPARAALAQLFDEVFLAHGE